MDAQAFWNVIGTYNQKTIIIQFVLLFMIAAGVIIARTNKKIVWTEKAVLGVAHLFIGIVFLEYTTQNLSKSFLQCLYILYAEFFFCMRHSAIRQTARMRLRLCRLC